MLKGIVYPIYAGLGTKTLYKHYLILIHSSHCKQRILGAGPIHLNNSFMGQNNLRIKSRHSKPANYCLDSFCNLIKLFNACWYWQQLINASASPYPLPFPIDKAISMTVGIIKAGLKN